MAVSNPVGSIRVYNQLFPQSDLSAESMPAQPALIYGPVGQVLAYSVAQGPTGGRLMQADANGNLKVALAGGTANGNPFTFSGTGDLKVFSDGGYETLPTPMQLNIVPSRTDTVSFNGADMVCPAFTVALFFLRVTAVSGTTPSMTVSIVGKDSSGLYTSITGGVSFAAVTSVAAVAAIINNTQNTSAALLSPAFRIQVTISGTTPSFTWFLDMVYK